MLECWLLSFKVRDYGKMRSYVSEKVKKKVNEIKVIELNFIVKMDMCWCWSIGDVIVMLDNIIYILYLGCIFYDYIIEG